MPDIDQIDPKKISVQEYIGALEEMFESGLDPSEVDPRAFARLVKHSSGKQLGELDTNKRAQLVIGAAFFADVGTFPPGQDALPQRVHHQVAAQGRLRARLRDGRVHRWIMVSEGQHADSPRVTLTMKPSEFIKVASGNASPTRMYMTRKLKLSGDLGFAAAFGSMFEIPKA